MATRAWKYGLGWPVSFHAFARALRVGCWRKRCRITDSGYFLRPKARVFLKNVEIRRLTYVRETSVASLFGCCARWLTRLCEAEKTGPLVSTESDESTSREERYGGGDTNGVYDFVSCTRSKYCMERGVSAVW